MVLIVVIPDRLKTSIATCWCGIPDFDGIVSQLAFLDHMYTLVKLIIQWTQDVTHVMHNGNNSAGYKCNAPCTEYVIMTSSSKTNSLQFMPHTYSPLHNLINLKVHANNSHMDLQLGGPSTLKQEHLRVHLSSWIILGGSIFWWQCLKQGLVSSHDPLCFNSFDVSWQFL